MVKPLFYGRMGNVAFQLAAAVAYCKKHNLEYTVPDKTNNPIWNPLYFQHLVNPNWNPNLETIRVNEPHFHYAEIPFEESWRNKNIILNGYWQSWKYFDEYREDIIKAFNLPYTIKDKVCAIHARYGDYETIRDESGSPKHIVMNEDYLKDAMKFIMLRTLITKFKVFSDDLPKFKSRHGHIYDFDYSTNTNEVDDLVEMSCCHSNICSASTYAWWAMYLNQNPDKKVVFPEAGWFYGNWDGADTKDVLPEWVHKR